MTLTEWYFNKDTTAKDITDEQFLELLDCLDFELKEIKLENGINVYYLHDQQGGNIANIEQDIFYANYSDYSEFSHQKMSFEEREASMWLDVKDQIISRLEIYLYDYFERDD